MAGSFVETFFTHGQVLQALLIYLKNLLFLNQQITNSPSVVCSWWDWTTLYDEESQLGHWYQLSKRAWLDCWQHSSPVQTSLLALGPTMAVQKCKQFCPESNQAASVKAPRKSGCVWPVSQAGWTSCRRQNGFRVGLIWLLFSSFSDSHITLGALFPWILVSLSLK